MRRYLLLLVGTALLAFYFARTDLRALLEKTLAFPPLYALGVVLLNFACGLVKTLRWKRFLRTLGVEVRLGPAYLAVHAAFFLGLVTPGTAGELTRAASLATGRRQGLAILVLEKLSDLAVLAALVAVTAASFLRGAAGLALAVAGLAALLASGYLVYLRHSGLLLRPLRAVLPKMVGAEGAQGAQRLYQDFNDLLVNRRLVLASGLYSLALWLLSLMQVALIYRGLGSQPPWRFVALSYFLPYFVGIVSLVPLGLGTFELSVRQLAGAATRTVPSGVVEVVPAFFRVFVTIPLILFGYACQVALAVGSRKRAGHGGRGDAEPPAAPGS